MISKRFSKKKLDRFSSEMDKWNVALENGNPDIALVHATNALQIAVGQKQHALAKVACFYVDTALREAMSQSKAAPKPSSPECSFCGRDGNEARVIVGADGQICEFCAANAFRFFTEETAKRKGRKKHREHTKRSKGIG